LQTRAFVQTLHFHDFIIFILTCRVCGFEINHPEKHSVLIKIPGFAKPPSDVYDQPYVLAVKPNLYPVPDVMGACEYCRSNANFWGLIASGVQPATVQIYFLYTGL